MTDDVGNPAGGGKQGNRPKRVRFSENTDVEVMPSVEEGVAPSERRQRQTILPGADEGKGRRVAGPPQQHQQPTEPEGPIRSLDPVLAATRRARFRAEASRMQLLEDTSMPDDLAAAEEDYDEPEELYNEGGIPIEPFHLRAEREAGYFDAEGNYLEYRLDVDDTDAWLESIMDEHRQVRADPALAARRRRAAAAAAAASKSVAATGGTGAAAHPTAGGGGGGSNESAAAAGGAAAGAAREEEEEEDEGEEDEGPYDMHILEDSRPPLDDEERAVYQKRIADLLQPGETPLDGLRRLGRVMHGGAASSSSGRGTSGGGNAGSKERNTARPQPPPAAAAVAAPTAPQPPAAAAAVAAAGGGAAAGGQQGDGAVAAAAAAAGEPGLGGAAAAEAGAEGKGAPIGPSGPVQLPCGERQRLRKLRRELQQQQQQPEKQQKPSKPVVRSKAHSEAGGKEDDDGGAEEEGHGAAGRMEGGTAGTRPAEVAAAELPRQEESRRAAHGDVEMQAVMEGGEGGQEPVLRDGDERPGDSPPSPPARQSAAEAAAAAAARRHPAAPLSGLAQEAGRQFDLLTSYSNLLLSAGLFDVYSSTREQLLRAAQRTLGVEVVRSLTLEGQRPVGQATAGAAARKAAAAGTGTAKQATAEAVKAGPEATGGPGGKRKRGAGGGPEEEEGAAAGQAAAGEAPAGEVAAGPVRGAAAAVDADVDMFGGDDEEHPGTATATAAAAASAMTSAATTASTTAVTVGSDQGARQEGVAAGGDVKAVAAAPGSSTDPRDAAAERVAAAAEPGTGPGTEVEAEALPDGYVKDPSTGYLYNSDLGYYYDVATGLYGDANTGLWYRFVPAAAAAGEGAGAGAGEGPAGGGGAGPGAGAGTEVAGGRYELVTAAEYPGVEAAAGSCLAAQEEGVPVS